MFIVFGISDIALGLFSFSRPFSRHCTHQEKIQEQEVATSKSAFATTQQQRKGVVKEIWFTQEDNSRLHYRIFSESSLLTIKPEGNSFDLIEKLEKIKCWMQDKLYEPSGWSWTDAADPISRRGRRTIPLYASQEFLAQSSPFPCFDLSGHELPKEMMTSSHSSKGLQKMSLLLSRGKARSSKPSILKLS